MVKIGTFVMRFGKMLKPRLVARLDIKGENLIKGIQLEGLRVIGNPADFAFTYYEQGFDELILMDAVASLYGRNNLLELISSISKNIFIPITVGGGIRTIDDIRNALRAGADKVAINTGAILNPDLIKLASELFGSQSIVLSVEAKKSQSGKWEAYTHNGREPSGLDVFEWVKTGVELGAGEILVTSVDREGTRKGFDVELIAELTNHTQVPIIASGGMGGMQHLLDIINIGKADAVAMADYIHYNKGNINEIKKSLGRAGINTRY